MSGSSGKESSLVSLHYLMLTRSNYTTWAIKMKVFMRAQGVWDIVEYNGKKEELDTKMDQTALAAIYQGIPEETLLAEKETSKEIVASIEQFGDLTTMTVEEVFGRLRVYEERLRCADNDDGVEHALLTKVQWKDMEAKDDDEHLLLTRAQWRAREQKDGGKNRKFDKTKVRCYKCNNYGHFLWECDESKKEEKVLFMAADEDHPALL
ncbi:unnamed protein product [Urochloa decumbens]|uniref:CCHC-type domain-containing protein n=1 Tax=Urochloa decumbens TaxID=240449 RepID=A0ABC9FPD9_9POAL